MLVRRSRPRRQRERHDGRAQRKQCRGHREGGDPGAQQLTADPAHRLIGPEQAVYSLDRISGSRARAAGAISFEAIAGYWVRLLGRRECGACWLVR
jgi:hypothetical protein